MYRNTRSTNRNSGNNWWFRHGKLGAGGSGPEAVKNIRKTAFSIFVPLSLITCLFVFGTHAGTVWFDNRYKGKGKTRDAENESELNENSPIDEEKKVKMDDLKEKNYVIKLLKLYDHESPAGQSLSTGADFTTGSNKPKPLVGQLVKLGDRLVLVSSPGLGKSIFSWMLAIAISEGRSPECMPPNTEHADPQKVFLYDGELDDDDIRERYGRRNYSPNLVRFAVSKFRTIYYLLHHIHDATIGLYEDSTVILDNLYALMPTMTNEETRVFLDGLDNIQRLAMEKGHRTTFILVTHTVKDVVGIPQLRDVAGSANISRFAKSEVALAAIPKHPNLVALVTNKKRYSDKKDAYILEYSNDGYVHFEYVDRISNEHIRQVFYGQRKLFDDDKGSSICTDSTPDAKTVQAMQELRDQGLSDKKIALRLSVSAPTVAKYIGSNGNGHHHGGRKPNRH